MNGLEIENVVSTAVDVPSVLAGYAASQPDTAAIQAPGRLPLSFAALYAQQQYVCRALAEWGISRGDPVAVLVPKGPEMAVALAVLPAAATVVAVDPNLSEDDCEKLFRRCSAKAIIVERNWMHGARAAANRTGMRVIELSADPDAPAGRFELDLVSAPSTPGEGKRLGADIAYILSTSGTTARRKLIPQPHGHIVAYAEAMKTWFRYDKSDVSIHLVPMYFSHGIWSALMVPLLAGTSIVCPPGYQADSFFALLEEFRPTWFSAGFTIYRDILRHLHPYEPIAKETPLRFMRSGSGSLEPAEIKWLEQAFEAPLIVPLSSTETGLMACSPLPPQPRKYESVGLPAVNEVRIRDEDGHFLDAGQEGEIVVRGPLVFQGYLDDPEANEEVFIDGWYRTGDLGKFDEDGYLYLTGRIKEVINRGGVKISPVEIDSILEIHPDVAEGAAFGLPHPTLGELVVAAVVLAPGADVDERAVRQHLRSHLAAKKVPSRIFFLDRLPRAENGKLQRSKLSDAVAHRQTIHSTRRGRRANTPATSIARTTE